MIRTIVGPYRGQLVRPCQGPFWIIPNYSLIVSTTATLLELAKFCSMDTLELCGDIMQPGGQLETPGLVTKIWRILEHLPKTAYYW